MADALPPHDDPESIHVDFVPDEPHGEEAFHGDPGHDRERRHGPGRRGADSQRLAAGTRKLSVLHQLPAGAEAALGLQGWVKTVGNTSALILFAVVFLWSVDDSRTRERNQEARAIQVQKDTAEQARDDRQLFRDELAKQRQHDSEQREATRAAFGVAVSEVRSAASEMRATRSSFDDAARAMGELAKTVKAAAPKAPGPTPKNPP